LTLPHRRHLLGAVLVGPWVLARGAAAQPDAAALIGAGGVVVALRHADAPGNFDPPGFRLGDCATQRNLGERGRVQAARIGAWFRERGLAPAAVRSSPWCRCLETARLAFGAAEPWDMLGSPRGSTPEVNAARLPSLRAALAAVPRGQFEVWVTHMFVLADFVGQGAASGESLVLRAGAGDAVQVLARVPPA
jgi:phosphohistidine phosphatase SixA